MDKVFLIRLYFLIVFLTFAAASVKAQDQKALDELNTELQKNLHDTVKLQKMLDVSWATMRSLPEQALEVARDAASLSKKLNRYKNESRALNTIGAAYSFLGKYDSSNFYYNLSLQIGTAKKDQKIISKGYSNIGLNHYYQGEYDKSIEYYLKAARLAEQLSDSTGMAIAYANLGNTYNVMESYRLSLEYLNKALILFTKLNNKQGMANSLNSIGSACSQVDSLKKQAPAYYERSLKLKEELNDRYGTANTLAQMGSLYYDLKDFNNSIKMEEKALVIRRELNDVPGTALVLNNLGNTYIELKKYDEAIKCHIEAVRLAREANAKITIKQALRGLSVSYGKKQDYKNAFTYRVRYSQFSDSMLNSDMTEQIAEMQTKYETEKKEKENLELKTQTEVQRFQLENESQKRRNQLILILSLGGFIGITSILVYNRRKQKQEAKHNTELAEAEKQRFKEVIEAEEKERSRIAQELHDGLGQLLSTARLNVAGLEDSVTAEDKPNVERSLKIIDDACVEVRSISHNMMPSALIRLGLIPAINELVNNVNSAKGIKIDFTSNVETSLGKSLDITIYRVVQEILNNMIRHAKADHINMSIEKTGDDLEISMQDNGVGFNAEELKNSKGIGWKNIFSRVSMLDGDIKLESELQKGTMVFINLKLSRRDVKNG